MPVPSHAGSVPRQLIRQAGHGHFDRNGRLHYCDRVGNTELFVCYTPVRVNGLAETSDGGLFDSIFFAVSFTERVVRPISYPHPISSAAALEAFGPVAMNPSASFSVSSE